MDWKTKKKSSSKIPRGFRASTPHDARIPAIRGPFAQSLSRHALTHSRATHAQRQTQSEGDQGREGRGGGRRRSSSSCRAAGMEPHHANKVCLNLLLLLVQDGFDLQKSLAVRIDRKPILSKTKLPRKKKRRRNLLGSEISVMMMM